MSWFEVDEAVTDNVSQDVTFDDTVIIEGNSTGGLAVGGSLYDHVLIASGYQGNPLTNAHQVAYYAAIAGNINASGAGSFVCGYETAIGTAAAAITLELLAHFSIGSVSKGSGSTITRTVGLKVVDETAGTNNAFLAKDGSTFSGDWFIYYEGTRSSFFGGKVTVAGGSAGDVDLGVWTLNSAWSAIGVAGDLGDGANILGNSTAGQPLIINRGSGRDISFREANTEQMHLSDTGGNLGLGTATFGTNATKTLALFNGTVPSTSPADTVQLFSADISAGNASLGIRTETAVVTETVTSDRTLSVTINGTVYKICLKA